jgi:hypothetical protein
VGCSGSGGGCDSSCGGVFSTTDGNDNPIKFTGTRLDNVAQLRVTASGFSFLNAAHLNDIFLQLSKSASLAIPCFGPEQVVQCSSTFGLTEANVLIGDTNFNAQCDATDTTPIHATFKNVSWSLDPAHNALRAHILLHLKTGDLYVRTLERHSSLCSDSSSPIQARIKYDDELPGLPQQDTAIDLNIGFATAPDGRLELNFDQGSLETIVSNFQPGAIVLDGIAGNDPAPPSTGTTPHDACGSGGSTYNVYSGNSLNCSGVFNDINANCNIDSTNSGVLCSILQYVRGYLLDYLKNTFAPQIVNVLRAQLDDLRCQQTADASGNAVACDASHLCPADDDGNPLACDTTRGVCYAPSQGTANFNCEPVSLGIAGEMNLDKAAIPVGFPTGTKLDLTVGLGSKQASGGGATVDGKGLQLAARAGTSLPSGAATALCVPPSPAPVAGTIPALDFDDPDNKPAGVGTYDVGFSLAGAMLNRGFYDAYNAGMLCIAVTNQTSSFISSALFKTILPSLGLVTGGAEVPMMILLRPTNAPTVRIGRNTFKTDANRNQIPDDPLMTLGFKAMNLDIYALVDERQVRIFTLQADLALPIGLRSFPDPSSDQLQPVLGSLSSVLTISAISPDGGGYDSSVDILSEDPSVVKDLIAAAVQLAQPLLAGLIKPIALPSVFNLKLSVQGVAGAVATNDVTSDGYNHLAVWTAVEECAGVCTQNVVKAQVKVASNSLPESGKALREGARPRIELDASAVGNRKAPEFSYRIDKGFWSPWLQNPRIVLQEPVFLFPGRHTIEVTARDQGDDRSQDLNPPSVDFFVSYDAPQVSLVQRDDGAVVTEAHSLVSARNSLKFSYRIDGEQSWSLPGPARSLTAGELQGRTFQVSVTDEAGRSTVKSFGPEDGLQVKASSVGGCATAPGQLAWPLLPLFALVAFMARRRMARAHQGRAPRAA